MTERDDNLEDGKSFAHVLLVLATFVIVVAGMKAAAAILVPFLCAVFLTILCAPFQARLVRRDIPQWLALTIILSILCLGSLFVLIVVGSSVAGFTENLDSYTANLQSKRDGVVEWLSRTFDLESAKSLRIREQMAAEDALGYIARAMAQLSGLLGNAAFILMMFAFMLAETPSLLRRGREHARHSSFAMEEIEQLGLDIGHYFAIKTWISLGTGVSLGLLYWAVDIDAPVLWAFIGFVFNFIPSIGSFLAAVPPLLLTFAEPGMQTSDTVMLLIGVVVVNLVFGNIIEPRVMGKGLDLSTTVVLLSLLFWGWVLGPVGMLLSVPLTIACKLALELDPRTRGLGRLLGAS